MGSEVAPIATVMLEDEFARLGRELWKVMDRLDPSGEEWETLTEREQEFYALAVRGLIKSPLFSRFVANNHGARS